MARGRSTDRRRTSTPPSGLPRAISCRRWRRWSVATRQLKGRASARPNRSGKRQRPPWGDILGGKPIDRQDWYLNHKLDRSEADIQREQYWRMLLLKNYYQIPGGEHGLSVGVAPSDGIHWYVLALRIAAELDVSLNIVDAKPRGKTSPRWRGSQGRTL